MQTICTRSCRRLKRKAMWRLWSVDGILLCRCKRLRQNRKIEGTQLVFKRRDRRSILATLFEALWPRGGWARAARYVQHRLNRLPDPPERIARGIFAGVLTTFTPFYGLHFVTAAILAWVMRGNILAALLSTFFGNPLTYVPIS